MGDILQPFEKAIRLERYHQRRGKHVERVSPKDSFEAKFTAAETRVREAYQACYRAGSVVMGSGGEIPTNTYLDDLEDAVEKRKELKSTRVKVVQEESEYQQRLEQEQADGLLEHLAILGPLVCKRVITKWFATQQPPPALAEDQVGNEGQPTYMGLEFTLVTADAPQPPAASLPIMNNIPATDQGHLPDMSTNDPQRPTEIKTMSLTKTSIEFDQVYQGGNASRQYVIGEYDKSWYILECKRHKKQFRTANPIQGAWKHLRSRKHYSDSHGVTYHMAVVELGTKVLNCDNDKAKLNNKRAIIHKSRKTNNPQNMDGTLSARASQSSTTMNTHRSHVSDIWPGLGDVYKTLWRSNRHRQYYAVLVLPLDTNLNFSHLVPDWDTSLKHTQLLSCLPPCYVQLENGRLEFTEDHKRGGSKECQRKYPVVFFHKTRFPHECNLGWVSVSDMEPYDPCDSSINHRHKQQVGAFKSNYGNAENARIEEANGDDVVERTAGTSYDRPPTLHQSSLEAEQSDYSRDSSALLYDGDIEFERNLTERTRENSSRVKEEVLQPGPMDTSGVPIRDEEVGATEQPAIPNQEEQDSQASDLGHVQEESDHHMGVKSHPDTVNNDTMTTPEGQLTQEEYHAILNGMSPRSSTTPFCNPMRSQAEIAHMSVDTQAGFSSTEVPISYHFVSNAVLKHNETSMHDVPQSPKRRSTESTQPLQADEQIFNCRRTWNTSTHDSKRRWHNVDSD
ncbi:hypothetical protein FSST1_008878 [Fusarium sambucinum]